MATSVRRRGPRAAFATTPQLIQPSFSQGTLRRTSFSHRPASICSTSFHGVRVLHAASPLRPYRVNLTMSLPTNPEAATAAARAWREQRQSRQDSESAVAMPTKKRIVVFSDGTWKTRKDEVVTNIARLAEALAEESDDGTQQVLLYDPGLGTESTLDAIFGGLLGEGIDENIMQLYRFISMNYEDGDEIYMFGFSRGAYTVRSLAGMIYEAGLVRKDCSTAIKDAYELYRKDVGPESKEAKNFRRENGERVDITLLGVFDTVGALGLPFEPRTEFVSKLNRKRYQFHNTRLSPHVKNAVHLLSIDEDRGPFYPTLMSSNDDVPDQLTQLYFPGRHSGVGGGSGREVMLSNLSLHFLINEMKSRGLGLKFIDAKLPDSGSANVPPIAKSKSFRNLATYAISGVKHRDIRSLKECHVPSVLERWTLQPKWRPQALKKIEEQIEAAVAQNKM